MWAGLTWLRKGGVFMAGSPPVTAGFLSGTSGLCFSFSMLAMRPRAWHMLGRCSTTELHLKIHAGYLVAWSGCPLVNGLGTETSEGS